MHLYPARALERAMKEVIARAMSGEINWMRVGSMTSRGSTLKAR